MSRGHPLIVALLLALLTPAGLLTAAHASQAVRLEQARAEYRGQEYETVIRLLAPLVQSPLATRQEKVEAYELLGLAYLIIGETKEARGSFLRLLDLDPRRELHDPSGSPKLKHFFDSVKAAFVPRAQPEPEVKLIHQSPRGFRGGGRLRMEVTIAKGGARVAQLSLRWRRSGELTYSALAMIRRGSSRVAEFILPVDESGYQLEYYIEARDGGGAVLARLGSPEEPRSLEVAPRPKRSVARSWWLWTSIGLAVAGGVAAGLYFGLHQSAPEGNLPPYIVQLR